MPGRRLARAPRSPERQGAAAARVNRQWQLSFRATPAPTRALFRSRRRIPWRRRGGGRRNSLPSPLAGGHASGPDWKCPSPTMSADRPRPNRHRPGAAGPPAPHRAFHPGRRGPGCRERRSRFTSRPRTRCWSRCAPRSRVPPRPALEVDAGTARRAMQPGGRALRSVHPREALYRKRTEDT